MLKAIRARFGRESRDDTRAKEREAKRLAKVLASHNAKEHYRNASGKAQGDPNQGGGHA